MYVEDYFGMRWLVAFASGAGLQSYTIPDGIMGLENYSFYYAEELTELTIPGSVTNIASAAGVFEGTHNIERLYGPNVLEDGRSYVVDNRLLYVADKGITEYMTPEGVEVLGYQVFADKQYLEKIVRVRTSAIILKALEISGAKVEIMSSPEKLKEVIENHFGIEIQVNENGCYKYSNQSGFNWGLECSQESKRRFELFNIIMIILESRE